MYIFKYALKSLCRSPIRHLLIGFVILVVTTASVTSLTIRQAADDIVAIQQDKLVLQTYLVLDRNLIRSSFGDGNASMRDLIAGIPPLTLDELNIYADSVYVARLDYSWFLSMNSESLVPVGAETAAPVENQTGSNSLRSQFQLAGYEVPENIAEFHTGEYQMKEGSVYALYESETNVLISEELAILNGLSIGDTLVLNNPQDPSRFYEMQVAGIYQDQNEADAQTSWFSASANQVIGHAAWVLWISEQEGLHAETTLVGQLKHTFLMTEGAQTELFRAELENKGLNEYYTLRSNNTELDRILQPFRNLVSFTSIFLWLILGAGALVLLTLNMIQIRERKYEIGVLRAIGMKKAKVACQFLIELAVITVLSMAIGLGSGSLLSEPVGNYMLSQEIDQVLSEQAAVRSNLGVTTDGGQGGGQSGVNEVDFIREIKTPLNPATLIQMMLIGLLIIFAGTVFSLISISRYEPLKILNTRT